MTDGTTDAPLATFQQLLDRKLTELMLAGGLFGGLPGIEVRLAADVPRDTLNVVITQSLPGPPERSQLGWMGQLPGSLAGSLHPADLAAFIESWCDHTFRPWAYPDSVTREWPGLTLWPRVERAELWWQRRRARRRFRRHVRSRL